MKWYLDLDDTLYKRTYGYIRLCQAVGQIYKIKPLSFGIKLLKTRKKIIVDGSPRYIARIFKTLELYGIDPISARLEIKNHLAGEDFLYEDARYLVEWLKSKQVKPAILTMGDDATQRFKISLIPELKGFEVITVQESKAEVLRKTPKHDAILVDDKIVPDLPSWCRFVYLARKPVAPDFRGESINSLTELIK